MPQKKKVTTRKQRILQMMAGLGAVLLILGFIAAYFISGFGYTVARIRCGHKPIYHTAGFKEDDEYTTPDHPDYKFYSTGNMFNKYYCNEEDAKADGLVREQTVEEDKATLVKMDEDELLKNSPVDFPVYEPEFVPSVYQKKEIRVFDMFSESSRKETIQDLYLSGAWAGYVRQGKVVSKEDERYATCNNVTDKCRLIGSTKNGEQIYVEFIGNGDTDWGIRKQGSYVRVKLFGQPDPRGVNDQSIVEILNSLKLVN